MTRLRAAALVSAYRWLGPIRLLLQAVAGVLLADAIRTDQPELEQFVTTPLREASRGPMTIALQSAMLGRPDLDAELLGIGVPTLLATGTEDQLWSPHQAEAFAAELSHGEFVAITSAAHLPQLETPEIVMRLLHDFWSRSH